MKEAVLALGNELKSDDSVGKYIIDSLRKKGSEKLLIYGGLAPENFFHKLKNVGSLYIVDAADFNGKPGEVRIFDDVPKMQTISTHSTDIEKMIRYVKRMFKIKKIKVILIQIKNISFGRTLSPEVKKSADKIVKLLS